MPDEAAAIKSKVKDQFAIARAGDVVFMEVDNDIMSQPGMMARLRGYIEDLRRDTQVHIVFLGRGMRVARIAAKAEA